MPLGDGDQKLQTTFFGKTSRGEWVNHDVFLHTSSDASKVESNWVKSCSSDLRHTFARTFSLPLCGIPIMILSTPNSLDLSMIVFIAGINTSQPSRPKRFSELHFLARNASNLSCGMFREKKECKGKTGQVPCSPTFMNSTLGNPIWALVGLSHSQCLVWFNGKSLMPWIIKFATIYKIFIPWNPSPKCTQKLSDNYNHARYSLSMRAKTKLSASKTPIIIILSLE